jgi:hypothetical protein
LEPCTFEFCLLQKRDAWIGVTPQFEEIRAGRLRSGSVTRQGVSLGKVQASAKRNRIVKDNSRMVEKFLEFNGSLSPTIQGEIGNANETSPAAYAFAGSSHGQNATPRFLGTGLKSRPFVLSRFSQTHRRLNSQARRVTCTRSFYCAEIVAPETEFLRRTRDNSAFHRFAGEKASFAVCPKFAS